MLYSTNRERADQPTALTRNRTKRLRLVDHTRSVINRTKSRPGHRSQSAANQPLPPKMIAVRRAEGLWLLVTTAVVLFPAVACADCDHTLRESCCQGTAAAFVESMLPTCHELDCQHTADGSCQTEQEGSTTSFSQCLAAAGCLTDSEYEAYTASDIEQATAASVLSNPCVTFPGAACHQLIDWCCNSTTLLVDGQAVMVTLVQHLRTVVALGDLVDCDMTSLDPEEEVGRADVGIASENVNLTCTTTVNASHLVCTPAPRRQRLRHHNHVHTRRWHFVDGGENRVSIPDFL